MKAQQKSEELLQYIKDHPDERFWQALRNWAAVEAILTDDKGVTRDTFYDED